MLNTLDLDDYGPLNDEVNSIAARNLNLPVDNRNKHLAVEREPAVMKLQLEAVLICRFKQTRPKRSVNLNGAADDFA